MSLPVVDGLVCNDIVMYNIYGCSSPPWASVCPQCVHLKRPGCWQDCTGEKENKPHPGVEYVKRACEEHKENEKKHPTITLPVAEFDRFFQEARATKEAMELFCAQVGIALPPSLANLPSSPLAQVVKKE